MIRVDNLTKKFGNLTVLKNLSAEINKGEVISIIGPSGCGKSTFMRCINLLEQPTEGHIYIEDEDILGKKAKINKLRQKMGMVFQSFNLYSHLTVIENVILGPIKLLKIPKDQALALGMKYLEMVGLSEKAYAYPDELSGGQKQRVAIARTLAMEPKIVLFDEPTSALDPTMVSEVLAVIRKLAKDGLTMMIVTHEMKFARDVSSRVFYMDECGIYEQGAPQQIFENPQKPKTKAFIYKIRTFKYTCKNKNFDLYELNGKLGEFLKRQMHTDQQIGAVELVTEELLCHILPDTKIELAVEYSDLNNTLELTATYGGEKRNPLQKGDKLSFALLNRTAKSVVHHYENEENRVTVIL